MVRWHKLLFAIVLLVPAAVVLPAGTTIAAVPRGAPDPGSAAAAARKGGVPVEDLSARTETSRVVAEPDGAWTMESYVLPQWTRRPGGAWADVDTTLARLPDGTLAPKASTADVRFSAGGTGPAVTLRRDGHDFTLTWPGTLPAPVVEDDSATYRDVLPGTDLVVRATSTGFSHSLVIRTREAAADPAVRRIRLRTGGDVKISGTPDGGLRIAAGSTAVATAGGALMWDAKGGTGPGRDPVAGPSDEARRAKVGLSHAAGELTLVPDARLLDDPATVFPVVVDPDYSSGVTRWTYATSDNSNSPTTDNVVQSADSKGPNVRVGKDVDVGKLLRTFLQFPMAVTGHDLRGKHILGAKFSGNVDHTSLCSVNKPNHIYRSAAIAATPRQSWPGPALQYHLGSLSKHANEKACSEPNQRFELNNGLLLSDMITAARDNWPTYTIGMAAVEPGGTGENTTDRWMRYFLNDFRLAVSYNTYPGTPDQLDTSGRACVTGTGRPWITDTTPELKARLTDGDPETDMKLQADWARILPDGTYGPVLGTVEQANLTAGTTGRVTLPELEDGGLYAWRARAHDGTDVNKADSGWCEFAIDATRPDQAPGVSSPLYKDDLENYYGSIGRTADFTFTPNGVTDVAGYEFGWSDPPTTYVAAPSLGAALTRQLTPPPPDPADPSRGGQLTLHVRSVDRAGAKSDITRYTFLIGSASGPAGAWKLDESGGTTLADSSGRGHPATLAQGTAGTRGHLVGEPAVTLDGVDDQAATVGPVLNTGGSFTVAAWVRPDNAAATGQTIVSQLGSRTGAFVLQKTGSTWSLAVASADSDTPAVVRASSATAPVQGVWTHLAGVYDRESGTVRLYVNGVPAGTATGAAPFDATGPLTIGRGRSAGAPADPFGGAVSDVRVWDRVVPPAELAELGATQVGWWKTDGDGADASGHGNDAVPTAVTWTEDRRDTPDAAAALNGAARLTTPGPVLYTDQSFTVSAWVRLNETGQYERTAVAQAGTTVSPFYLGLRHDAQNVARWSMQLRPADNETCCPDAAVGGTVKQGQWQFLVGVYDAAAGKVRLYVDAVKVAEVSRATRLWNGAGPLTIGFGKWAAAGDHWLGDLDEIRVHQGVLPESEIARLHTR
ncbi:LamG domain-containing protein [Actinocorallia longicatena]|uniref:LamG domain-containing protein n=1 Tax=Actinocorallia longicatena TaxID=111803 RepID=A0ABP6QIH5_9ACTN